MTETRLFTAGPDDHGTRLDHYLTSHCPDLSRSQIKKAFDADLILVNGTPQPPRFRKLRDGVVVSFTPPEPPPQTAEPEDIPLNIVFQDEHLAVINKPAGLVVHPAPGHYTGTLVNALLYHFKDLPDPGENMRPGIVHRLDKETTGLMVVALNSKSLRHLSAQLQDRTLGRRYTALCWGQWNDPKGQLVGQIDRHVSQRKMMAIVETGGRKAICNYEVLEDYGFAQLCSIKLDTGRTHQIRVQFANGSHPVIGDSLYGDDNRARNVHSLDVDLAKRTARKATHQMLHATDISFEHPETGELMEFSAPLPEPMNSAVKQLRTERS
jgi:23S rRNA pseudouridine1911/1915/1917 synthase